VSVGGLMCWGWDGIMLCLFDGEDGERGRGGEEEELWKRLLD
jgi:hypothetical protein